MELQLSNYVMYFNYIFYWVVWHVINYNFTQVIVILLPFLVTFLITFSHSLWKMCFERTKINLCHKCFSTFLLPSASFLHPSWIYTLLAAYFYLFITDLGKMSIMYHGYVWLVQTACEWQHSGRVILHTLHTWNLCSVGLCTLVPQHQVPYATHAHCSNVS